MKILVILLIVVLLIPAIVPTVLYAWGVYDYCDGRNFYLCRWAVYIANIYNGIDNDEAWDLANG